MEAGEAVSVFSRFFGFDALGARVLRLTLLVPEIVHAILAWTLRKSIPMDMLINGEVRNVTDLSKRLGKKNGYIGRILSLNSLAPDIVESILAGTEPAGLTLAKLTEQPIPEDWNEQRRLYGFPEQ